MRKRNISLFILLILLIGGYFIKRAFENNRTPLEVIGTFPQNFSQDAPVDLKTIKFTFSESIDPSNVSYELVSGIWPGKLRHHWENDNKTLCMSINGNLEPGITYALIMNPNGSLGEKDATDKAMKDLHGNLLPRFPLIFVTRAPKEEQLRKKLKAGELLDTDNDGLEDSLEIAIGTSIDRLDTDRDELSDYEEYCKYRTDATRADSDEDGRLDSDWDERREYTYTIKAICQFKPPVDIRAMSDLFQDAKKINEDTFEVVLYPQSTPRLIPAGYEPIRDVSNELSKYLNSSFAINYSQKMQDQIKEMVSHCETDRDVLNQLQIKMGKMQIVPLVVNPLHLRYTGGKVEFTDSTNPIREKKINKSLMKYLKQTYFADSMFHKNQFSSCASRATLRAAMLRAAGFPTKIAFAVPLLYVTESRKENLIKGLKSDWLKEGIYVVSDTGSYVVDHVYNEVYLNNHWIRVDYAINEGILFANKYPYIKILSLLDWTEENFSLSWAWENWPDDRPYKTLSVSENFPLHQSRYENHP